VSPDTTTLTTPPETCPHGQEVAPCQECAERPTMFGTVWLRMLDHLAEHIEPVDGCAICDMTERSYDRRFVDGPAK
jgi:hypothetical protein